MSNIVEKYSRALKMYRDDGISVPVLPSEMRALIADFLAIKEHCAALESREVCTVAHEDVETCGYCQRDAMRKDAERYRWLRENVGYVIDGGDYAVRGLAMDLAIDSAMERGHSPAGG